jgi:hypothetical protein
MKTQARSGGGITSNKLVSTEAKKAEPKSRAINPAAADGIGQTTAFKKPPLESGPGYKTLVGPTSNMGQGPGAGRTV